MALLIWALYVEPVAKLALAAVNVVETARGVPGLTVPPKAVRAAIFPSPPSVPPVTCTSPKVPSASRVPVCELYSKWLKRPYPVAESADTRRRPISAAVLKTLMRSFLTYEACSA